MATTGNNSTEIYNNTSGTMNSTNDSEIVINESVPFIVVVSFISVLGIGGNLLVLLAIAKETVATYLIGHLSLVDLLMCCITFPWFLTQTTELWSKLSCFLLANTITLLPNMSIQSQCLISLNRYVLVVKSNAEYMSKFNKRRTAIALLIIWMINILSVPSVYWFVGNLPSHQELYFGIGHPHAVIAETNIKISIAFAVLAFFTSFFCYGKLIAFVRKSRWPLNAAKRRDSKASMTLLLLLVLFFVSLIIAPMLLILRASGIYASILICVLFLNSVINPILYGFKIRSFKETFKKMLCPCVSPRRIEPTSATANVMVISASDRHQY